MSHRGTDEHLMRQALVAITKGMSTSKACHQFGISPATFKKWERRRSCNQRSISFRAYSSPRRKTDASNHSIPLGIRNIKMESQTSNKVFSSKGNHRIIHNLPDQSSDQMAEISEIPDKAVVNRSQGWSPDFLREVIGGWVGEPLERSPQPLVGKDEQLMFVLPEE